jgi:hypothetical protein
VVEMFRRRESKKQFCDHIRGVCEIANRQKPIL